MATKRVEIQHYEPEQVEADARDALAMVERLAPPPELAAAVFTAVYGSLSAKTVQIVNSDVPVLGGGFGLH